MTNKTKIEEIVKKIFDLVLDNGFDNEEKIQKLISFIEIILDDKYQDGFSDGAEATGTVAKETEAIKVKEARGEERDKIYKDLMEIADQWELEELRVQVEIYFKGLNKS